MIPLKCDFQPYQWGKPANVSRVADLLRGRERREEAVVAATSSCGGIVGCTPPPPSAVDEAQRYAELWIGTHPSKPSMCLVPSITGNCGGSPTMTVESTTIRLAELLGSSLEQSEDLLGKRHLEFFNGGVLGGDNSSFSSTQSGGIDGGNRSGGVNRSLELPFLLKVLSIDKALSIQAHPDRERARVMHAADPSNYPDPNHKPELVVALTPFECLCCFRPLVQIAAYVEQIPGLRELMGPKNADNLLRLAANNNNSSNNGGCGGCASSSGESPGSSKWDVCPEQKEVLQSTLDHLYQRPSDEIRAVTDAFATQLLAAQKRRETESAAASSGDRVEQQNSGLRGCGGDVETFEERVFLRISSQFPGDVGCWMVFILNLCHLQPGEGLFLAPNEPHSYLDGDCVEIMAASDNVVRAGLTPKFKDVTRLLEMLTYRTDSLDAARFPSPPDSAEHHGDPGQEGGTLTHYAPPAETFPEFSLKSLKLTSESVQAYTLPGPLHSFGLGVVVSGDATMTIVTSSGSKTQENIGTGSTFALPVGATVSFTNVTTTGTCGERFHVFIGQTNTLPPSPGGRGGG